MNFEQFVVHAITSFPSQFPDGDSESTLSYLRSIFDKTKDTFEREVSLLSSKFSVGDHVVLKSSHSDGDKARGIIHAIDGVKERIYVRWHSGKFLAYGNAVYSESLEKEESNGD